MRFAQLGEMSLKPITSVRCVIGKWGDRVQPCRESFPMSGRIMKMSRCVCADLAIVTRSSNFEKSKSSVRKMSAGSSG